MIKNSYSVGTIKALEGFKSSWSSLRTFGGNRSNNELLNCFYLENSLHPLEGDTESTHDIRGIKKTEKDMKSEDFIKLLNSNQESSPWKMDAKCINGGFPILSWQ